MATSLLIVAGAGASFEADLPIGDKLKDRIAHVLNIQFADGYSQSGGDGTITEAFRALVRIPDGRRGDINPHIRTAQHIREAMPQAASIDNFIDGHRSDEKIAAVGKLAIARCILEAESKSRLAVDQSNVHNKINFNRCKDTWYNAFFRLIVEGCQVGDLPSRLNEIAFITFNYDRCIEHYLHQAIMNYYRVGEIDAATLVSNLRIYHAYGSLGPLPWANPTSSVRFGNDISAGQLIAVSHGLKTFTESIDETHSDIVEIRKLLREAKRTAFIGFAYNKQNLQLLYGKTRSKAARVCQSSVIGTALNMSDSDVEIIEQQIRAMGNYGPKKMSFRNLSAANLFSEYGRWLSLT